MKAKKLLYVAIVSLLLTSCGNEEESNKFNYSITPINQEDLKVNNIYSAIKKLQTLKNFTLSITMTDDEKSSFSFDNIYAEHYYYCNYEDDENGFIEDENGIYRVNLVDNQLLASDLYLDENGQKMTDLYNSGVLANFTQLNLDNFKTAIEDDYVVTNKKDKLTLMNILELDNIYYATLSNCEFKLLGSTMNNLYLILDFTNGTSLSCAFNNFGESEEIEVINYKAQNKTYTKIDDDLYRVRDLFKLNNYRRVCHENENPEENVIGYEWFNENYFYGDYIVDEYSIAETGYIGLKNKTKYNEETKTYTDYDGAYLFFLNDTYSNLNFYGYKPAFTTTISYMPDIMNYPSNLIMFDYNLQFFEKVDDSSNYEKNVYVTTDLYIIQDWLTNFQISLTTEDNAEVYIYDLRIITDLYTKDSDCTVTFQFDYVIEDTVYGLQREFIDFGTSNIEIVDEFYASFEDKK